VRKKLTVKGVLNLFKKAFKGFLDDKIVKLSGSLAYFTVFSLGPMLIVIIYFADIFYGRDAIEGSVYGQIASFVGADAALQIQEIIRNAYKSKQSTLTATLGFITLFIAATGIFSEIQDSLNTIWGLKPKPKKGWIMLLMNRVLSFSVVIGLGFLLLVSLIITAIVESLSTKLMQLFPGSAVTMLYIINLLLTFIITTVLFGIIFKILPDARIRWRDVLFGAIVTAILFMLGKFAITFYIGTSDIGTTYGAAGSFVVVLSWIYYSSLILYFGAEFTKAYATVYGGIIKPNNYAVWIKTVEVEEGKGSLKAHEHKKQEENEQSGEHIKVK
jgi:membrane protein